MVFTICNANEPARGPFQMTIQHSYAAGNTWECWHTTQLIHSGFLTPMYTLPCGETKLWQDFTQPPTRLRINRLGERSIWLEGDWAKKLKCCPISIAWLSKVGYLSRIVCLHPLASPLPKKKKTISCFFFIQKALQKNSSGRAHINVSHEKSHQDRVNVKSSVTQS